MEAKKLTENSYLLYDKNGTKIGLAFRRGDNIISTHDTSQVFKSLEDIAFLLKENIVYSEIPNYEKEETKINGFPIKHGTFFSYEEDNTGILYKVRETSNIQFYAGWWVIKTNNSSYMKLSPKSNTVHENEVIGPFKEAFECKEQLRQIKR